MPVKTPPTIGLVMAAGGARAAYQAGVMRRISELPRRGGEASPFQVLEGVSAGAINAAAIASGAEDLGRCARHLTRLWGDLRMSDVVRTDPAHLLANGLLWLWDLTFGGVAGGGHARSLLDVSPLRRLLTSTLDLGRVAENVRVGLVRALSVIATDYASGRTCAFIEGADGVPLWNAARRVAVATPISVDHLLASAAIPVLFAPVPLDTPHGRSWYGDGCLRLPAPLGPVIRLGADRILAIGLRHHPLRGEPSETPLSVGPTTQPTPPPLAQVLGVSLSALFIDQLDSDTEHLERINRHLEQNAADGEEGALRSVASLFITPSVDLAAMAELHVRRIPAQIRYLLGGLGTNHSANAELLSYLLFERDYTRALIDIGYRDAEARSDEIAAFLSGGCGEWAPPP